MKLRSRILIVTMLLALGMAASAAFAQKIIVNEVLRDGTSGNTMANTEWIEILVLENLTAAQLEGFYVGDSTSTPNSRNATYKFTAMVGIAATFPAGTLIVIGGTTAIPTEDLTLNPGSGDYTIKIASTNATYLTASGTPDFAATEVAWVDTVGTGDAAVTADGFAVKWGTGTGTFGTAASVTATAVPAAPNTISFTSNLAGATTPANWNSAATATMGEPNGGDNSAYIASLRGTVADNPDAALTGSGAFGKVSSTGTKDAVITIGNAVGATNNLIISSPGFNFSGANAAKFAVVGSPTFPITVTPGNSTTLTIRYTPGEAATHVATADLTSNDAHNPSLSLSGEGVTYTVVANITARPRRSRWRCGPNQWNRGRYLQVEWPEYRPRSIRDPGQLGRRWPERHLD